VTEPVTEPAADTVATLAAAAGVPLGPDRCEELAPLYEMLLGSLEHLRTVDLGDHEPLAPGGVPGRRDG
jgi:hypothetical protein